MVTFIGAIAATAGALLATTATVLVWRVSRADATTGRRYTPPGPPGLHAADDRHTRRPLPEPSSPQRQARHALTVETLKQAAVTGGIPTARSAVSPER